MTRPLKVYGQRPLFGQLCHTTQWKHPSFTLAYRKEPRQTHGETRASPLDFSLTRKYPIEPN